MLWIFVQRVYAMGNVRVVETPLGRFVVREGKPQDLEPLREYEALVLRVLERLAETRRVFVDVGANVGKYVVPLAKRYEKVYAVEPDPDNLEALIKNIEINGIVDRVVVVPKALGSAPGVAHLAQAGAQSRIADRGIEVEVTTLDECCPDAEAVKIDVEGFELEVIKGALRTIEVNRPAFLIEHHEYIFGIPLRWHPEIARILMDRGYVAIRVRYPHFLYVPRERFTEHCPAVLEAIGNHVFIEKIMDNLRHGLPWYYGLSGTWWHGMDVPEYIEYAGRHIGCEEALRLAEAEIDAAARGKVFRF